MAVLSAVCVMATPVKDTQFAHAMNENDGVLPDDLREYLSILGGAGANTHTHTNTHTKRGFPSMLVQALDTANMLAGFLGTNGNTGGGNGGGSSSSDSEHRPDGSWCSAPARHLLGHYDIEMPRMP